MIKFLSSLSALKFKQIIHQGWCHKGRGEKLPPLMSLTVFYLTASLLVFFVFFTRLELAIVSALFICFCWVEIARHTNWQELSCYSPLPFFLPIGQKKSHAGYNADPWFNLGLIIIITLLLGRLGYLNIPIAQFGQSYDWYKHHMIINTLLTEPFPSNVTIDKAGTEQHYYLRYYLGYYLTFASILKLFQQVFSIQHGQYIALTLWTGLGLYLLLQLAFDIIRQRFPHLASRKNFFILCLVFFLFSGLDYLGAKIFIYPILDSLGEGMHAAIKMAKLYDAWSKVLGGEISSNITNLYWVPQHALGIWLGLLLLLQPKRYLLLSYAGLLAAGLIFWSPYSFLGLTIFALWVFAYYGFAQLCNWRNLLAAMILVMPIIYYFSVDLPDYASFQYGFNQFFHKDYYTVITFEFVIPALLIGWYIIRNRQNFLPEDYFYGYGFILAVLFLLIIFPMNTAAKSVFESARLLTASIAMIALSFGFVIIHGFSNVTAKKSSQTTMNRIIASLSVIYLLCASPTPLAITIMKRKHPGSLNLYEINYYNNPAFSSGDSLFQQYFTTEPIKILRND